MGINTTTLSGNLGSDPETRYTPNGKEVCNFSIGVNTFKQGQKHTFWVDCVAWEKVANLCGEYLRKGHTVTVSGQLDYESWTDRDSGKQRGKHVLVVRDVQLPPKQEELPY